MSDTPNPYRSGAYAAYMASNFSSAARLCAHETDFIAARVRVLKALGIASTEEASSIRTLARKARSQELMADIASDRSHDASAHGLAHGTVSFHTSVALGHREKAHELEDRARKLEHAITRRGQRRWATCEATTSAITVWRVPLVGRPQIETDYRSLRDELREQIANWARDARARDQLLLCVSSEGRGVVQVARPMLHTDIWPWTVRVLPGQLSGYDRDDLPRGLVSILTNRRFVSHFDRGLWCHVAPGQPEELAIWLVAVLGAVAVER